MTTNEIITNLTKRELESLEKLVLTGSVKEAAKAMNISTRTVEGYIERIKIKLRVQYRSQLNKIYIETFYRKKTETI